MKGNGVGTQELQQRGSVKSERNTLDTETEETRRVLPCMGEREDGALAGRHRWTWSARRGGGSGARRSAVQTVEGERKMRVWPTLQLYLDRKEKYKGNT